MADIAIKLVETASRPSGPYGRRRRQTKVLKSYAVQNAETGVVLGHVEEELVDVERKLPGRRWVEERWKAPRWRWRREGSYDRAVPTETRKLAIAGLLYHIEHLEA